MNQQKKTANLNFRKAQISDAQAISHLVNSAYRGNASRTGWTTEAELLEGQRTDPEAIVEAMQNENQFFLLGERDGKLKASVLLEQKGAQTCYFGMFAVCPEQQSQGIGKLFIEEAERVARDELKCQKMEMTVITLRKELIAYYERRGYRLTGEIRPFPYGNERFGVPLREDLQLGVLEKNL